jgi:hypothetical protein
MLGFFISLYLLGTRPALQDEINSAVYWKVVKPLKQCVFGMDQTFTPAGFNHVYDAATRIDDVRSHHETRKTKETGGNGDNTSRRRGS